MDNNSLMMEMNNKVIKNVTLTEKDFTKFQKLVLTRAVNANPRNKKIDFIKNIILWAVIGFALVSIYKVPGNDLSGLHWPTALIVSIPLLFFMFTAYNYSQLMQKRMIPNENGLILGKKRVEFCAKGMTDTTDLGYSFYQWDAIQDVVKSDGDLYVFLDKILAQILPSTSFQYEQEMDELIPYIEKNRHNNNSHQKN